MIRSRRALVWVAGLGLLVLVFYWGGTTPRRSEDVSAPVALREQPRPAVATRAESLPPVTTPVPRVASPQPVPRPQPPELPYSFLGRITEGGIDTIVLHGAGRTLKVRGLGPLDENYAVEAIRDDHLLLRHIPTGAQQALALESRNYGVMFGGSAADTPQD
jgi:hypothetical protein